MRVETVQSVSVIDRNFSYIVPLNVIKLELKPAVIVVSLIITFPSVTQNEMMLWIIQILHPFAVG